MGEYARSAAIATQLARQWPEVQVHFALSAKAPYAANCPFPATLLPSSPTYHTPEVIELIRNYRPNLVIFDNAGRTEQARAAVEAGARIVFVSSRPRQRRRAFGLRWMRMLDEHWIGCPEFVAGAVGGIERLKMKIAGGPRIRFLDAVLPLADEVLAGRLRTQFDLQKDRYILVAGGGTHPGMEHAPAAMAGAANRIAMHGHTVVLVGDMGAISTNPALRVVPHLQVEEMGELMRGARLVVCNGGDTLLQALSFQKPCITAAIAKDQPRRVLKCVDAGVAIESKLDSTALSDATLALLTDEPRRRRLQVRLADAQLRNALPEVVSVIESLLGLERSSRTAAAEMPTPASRR